MKNFMSRIFEKEKAKQPEDAPLPQPQVEAAAQQPPPEQAAQTSFTTATGFNLPGIGQPQQEATNPPSSEPVGAPSGMPGLFAGMGVPATQPPPAQETPAPVQATQQPAEEKKRELPGLFAGLGMSAMPTPPALAAPTEEKKEEDKPQGGIEAFKDLLGPKPPQESGAPQEQQPTSLSSMLGINPYEPNVPASDPQRSSSLGLFNFGAAPPQTPAPQAPQAVAQTVPVEQPSVAKVEQEEPPSQPSTGLPGLFSGLNTSASEPKQETPKQAEAQNTSMSAFNFMSGGSGLGMTSQQEAPSAASQQPAQPAASANSVANQQASQPAQTSSMPGLFSMLNQPTQQEPQPPAAASAPAEQPPQQQEPALAEKKIDLMNDLFSPSIVNNAQPDPAQAVPEASPKKDAFDLFSSDMKMGGEQNIGDLSGIEKEDKAQISMEEITITKQIEESTTTQEENSAQPPPEAPQYTPKVWGMADLQPTPEAPAAPIEQPKQEEQPVEAPVEEKPAGSMFSFMTMGGSAPVTVQQPPVEVAQPMELKQEVPASGSSPEKPSIPSYEPGNPNQIPSNFELPAELSDHDSSIGKIADTQEEEGVESREMIEDKIFAIKQKMVDFTVKQWDILQKVHALNDDIKTLQDKIEETTDLQQTAIDTEDYEKADTLDMDIKQQKKLIESKELQIRQLQSNNMGQESLKADKLSQLSDLMKRSATKIDGIRDKLKTEMGEYEEAETATIAERTKRQHYEKIRITEEKKEFDEDLQNVEASLDRVNKQVYEDTKDQHQEKHKLDNMIDDLNKEIEDLLVLLERKKKEKDMLILEKQVHERKIEQARMKYKSEIDTMESKKEKLEKKLVQNEAESEDWKKEDETLTQYKQQFDERMDHFAKELKNLDGMEHYLSVNQVQIDESNRERKEVHARMQELEEQIRLMKVEQKQINQGKEFITERVQRLEQDQDDYVQRKEDIDKKLAKLEVEKKKFAAAKKFRDAKQCQNEMKELEIQLQAIDDQIKKTEEHRQEIEADLKAQTTKLEDIEAKMADCNTDKEKTQLIILTYRKEEITDLIQCLTKALDLPEAKSSSEDTGGTRNVSLTDQSRNDLSLKRETLQLELTNIHEELFELEKKYGKMNPKPDTAEPVHEEEVPSEEPVEENKEDEAEEVAEEEVADESIGDASQKQEEVVPNNEEEQEEEAEAKEPSQEEMQAFIDDFEKQVAEYEEAVDAAAEEEDFEKAEEMQEKLEALQSQCQEQVDKYKIKLQEIMEGKTQLKEAEPPLQTQDTTQSDFSLQYTGNKGYEYTSHEIDLLRQSTTSPMFMLSTSEIADIIGEAKKYKIAINENDLRLCGRKASKLFKQRSITSDIIQNLVDQPEDEFKEDDDMVDYDINLPEEVKTKKEEMKEKVIDRIVTQRIKDEEEKVKKASD